MSFQSVRTKMVMLMMTAALVLPVSSIAQELQDPLTWIPTLEEVRKGKAFFDDPRPILDTVGPYKVAPKALLDTLTFDVDEMKALWSEIRGFKAPDVVGKIAPEIKPGKYTWQEVKENPGFKELMIPLQYERVREAGPPTVGAFEEIEVIPTRQYYWSTPIAEATKKNAGKTKLDEQGYIIPETWEGGFPFPRPSGKFKGQQIVYNHYHRYSSWGGNCAMYEECYAFDGNGRVDNHTSDITMGIRNTGRVLFKPYGAVNDRAKKRMENYSTFCEYFAPRDNVGTTYLSIHFTSPQTLDQNMIYLPGMRRIRKFSATDSQDQWPGYSATYDDFPILSQKLSPDIYPYEYEVIDEREFLVNTYTEDGAAYASSEKWNPYVGAKFERRPVYVVQMTQLDKSYQYSKRILYVDKESLVIFFSMNYDQKNRLWRFFQVSGFWYPKMGMLSPDSGLVILGDLVDTHSEIYQPIAYPANMPAEYFSMRGMIRRGK